MTNSEAIRIINQYDCNFYWTDGEKIPTDDLIDAFELAVKALDETEPRVLTLKEVKKLQSIRDGAIWLETFGNGLFPALPEFSAGGVTFFVAILFNGYRSVFDNDWYGKTWRCWSARPTDELREATPWDE